MKIVVAEKISAKGTALLEEISGWRVVGPEEFAKDPAAAVADADALIVRSAVQADAALLANAGQLKIVGRAGVGVDNIDVDAATHRGIVVMNAPGASSVAVAELALGLMLALARKLPQADATTRAGKWEKKSLQGVELNGKTLGVVGLGRIGLELARRAQAFGMTVIATDPYASPTRAAQHHVTLLSADELYAQADYISLHLGLTPQTSGMINAEAIGKMKKGARLINCARGELIDETAVAVALASGQLGGAAIDVYAKEPPGSSPLFAAPNALCTPHLGASTKEAQEAVGIQIASQVREYLLHGVVQNAVNVLSLTETEYEQLSPYMRAAQRSGQLAAQLFESNLEQISITYEGALREWKTDLLRNAAIAGVLQQDTIETVNLVNAASTAEERGVRVVEHKNGLDGAINAIRVTLRGADGSELTTRSTVIHRREPRIVELNGIEIEAPLEGLFLINLNRDLPGVVGALGLVLGNNGVNIASLSLGREPKQPPSGEIRKALAIVQVDEPVQKAVLEQIEEIPAVIRARFVTLK